MSNVRRALHQLRETERQLWTPDAPPVVAVDRAGQIILNPSESPRDLAGQGMLGDHRWLNLVLPFETDEGTRGPDLVSPRPSLRIIPGKLGGEPHVARSRVETRALAALARRGMDAGNIVRLYPALKQAAIVEAIDLEDQLARNLSVPIAA